MEGITMDSASVDRMAVVDDRATEVAQLKRAMGKSLVTHTPRATRMLESCFRRALPTARPVCKNAYSVKVITPNGEAIILETEPCKLFFTVGQIKKLIADRLGRHSDMIEIFYKSLVPLSNFTYAVFREQYRAAIRLPLHSWDHDRITELRAPEKTFTAKFQGKERLVEWDSSQDVRHDTARRIMLTPAIECISSTTEGGRRNKLYLNPRFQAVDDLFYPVITSWEYTPLSFEELIRKMDWQGTDGVVMITSIDGKVNGQEVRLKINIKKMPSSFRELAAARGLTLEETFTDGRYPISIVDKRALKLISEQIKQGHISPGFKLKDKLLSITSSS
ncbi:hypothetical protein K0U07_00130 [bacterium]|nr:hypothetical protein [bacterium]